MVFPAGSPGLVRRYQSGAALLLLTLLCLLVAVLRCRDFTHPIIAGGDLGQWENIGLLFGELIRFFPLPHLHLWTDAGFYPYGVNPVYLSWCFERDAWYALWYALFGLGPWLQWYYVLSLLIGTLGTYVLLRGEFGTIRAAVAGAIATPMNIYAFLQWPGHMNIAAAHWLTLNIIADFLMFRRITQRQWPSLRWLLLRATLLVLVLGNDLPYHASLAMLSFSVAVVFTLILGTTRAWRERPNPLHVLREQTTRCRAEAVTHPISCVAAALTLAWIGWFLIPLTLHTAYEAVIMPRATVYASSVDRVMFPLRPWMLAFPFLPSLEPRDWGIVTLGGGVSQIGWALLAVALMGLWGARRNVLPLMPLLTVLFLVSINSPAFPVQQWIPWMSFTRVAERATILFPIACAILSLYAVYPGRRMVNAMVIGGLITLGAVEVLHTASRRPYLPFVPDARFDHYMQTIRATPGEAILDWPFVISAGNTIGQGFDPYHEQGWVAFAMRRFHGKKTIGHNFGRLQLPQLEPFLQAGWMSLVEAAAEERNFTPAQWTFLDEFLARNDFCGIALYPTLLPREMVNAFIARYGEPVATARLPSGVDAMFIPKPPAMRGRVDPEQGRTLQLDEPLARTRYGVYLYHEGRPREAIPHLQRALELEEDEHNHLNLAAALLAVDRLDEAESHLRYALERGGSPRTHALLRELNRRRAEQGQPELPSTHADQPPRP